MFEVLKNIKYFVLDLKVISYKYWLYNIIITVLTSLNTTISLIFFKKILDNISLNDSYYKIMLYISLYSFYLFISSLLKILLNDIYNPQKNIIVQQNLQKVMFNKIKNLDVACYENAEFYNKYVRAMNEIDNRYFQIVETIMQLFAGFMSVLSISILISTLSPLYILFAIFLVTSNIVKGYFSNKHQYLLDKENTQYQRERAYVKRIFYLEQYIKELKLYQSYNLFVSIYEKATDKIIININKHYKNIVKIDMYSMLSNVIITVLMVYILCNDVLKGSVSVSDFMILFTSVNNLSTNLSGLFSIIPKLGIHSLYINNILEVLNFKSIINDSNNRIMDNEDFRNICFRNVNFSYDQYSKDVLKNISLEIQLGKKIAIVGRNGSGKSTFIKLLLRLYDPQSGIIEINNKKYTDLNINTLRANFSVMFQEHNLYSLTIAENILMVPIECKEQEDLVWESLKFSGLYDKVKKLEDGINTIVTKEFDNKGIYFSGGEKQLLSIARAYASSRSVFVFDEPTSSLDAIFEKELFSKLKKIGEDKTVIFITHKLYTTIDADVIYFFEDGSIIESGTHEELINLKGKYYNMFNIQITKM